MPSRKTSIAVMVSLALVTVTTLVIVGLGAVSYHQQKNRELEYVRVALALDADQIAPSLHLPVWNFDHTEIDKVVEGMMLDPILQAVVVKSADQKTVICARERDERGNTRGVKEAFPAAGCLVEQRNITLDGETLATVTLYGTTKTVDEKMRGNLVWIIFNIVWVDSMLLVSVYLLLRGCVFKPLREIEAYAAAVSAGGSAVQGRTFRGELESLRSSIAKMFSLLNTRYQELQESEERFRNLTAAAFEGITISENGRILDVNDRMLALFGYTRDEMIGTEILQLVAPESRALVAESIRTGREELYEHQLLRKDGSIFYAEARARMVQAGGRTLRMTAVRDITERRRAEAERAEAVSREARARAEYTLQLIAAQEAERARIACELHDSLGQELLLIKNRAHLALNTKDISAGLREQLTGISELAVQAVAEVRQISHDLHPHQLDHLGLAEALRAMIEGTVRATGFAFDHRIEDMGDLFQKDAATNLYRIVQESMNNILKHSHATRARITLERDVHEVQLKIEDDGVGFASDGSGLNGGKGLGLKNITERVRMLGGSFKLDSAPGKGTRIKVSIPIADG